jgi:hypothetical protein
MTGPFDDPPPELDPPDIPPTDTPTDETPPSPIPAAPVTNIKFAWYDPVTGAIPRVGHCAEPSLPTNEALYPELGFILGEAVPETHKVDVTATPKVIVARPTFSLTISKTTITADGTDSTTISGIPAGTLVKLLETGDFPESAETVNTGSTTLKTVYPVPHTLRFTLFPYQQKDVVINAV